MENKKEQTNKESGFFAKVKNGIVKFLKGVKNFFIKTGRVNSSNCYGIIEGIGDLLVYDDHALISAVGMDDITFTKDNVISYAFDGLGRIRRNKATVKYKIILNDNVVFPEKVREKNDVKNLSALINIEKDKGHFLGSGTFGLNNCFIYGYKDCLIIVLKLERRVGDKTEKYEESRLYPLSDIDLIQEKINKGFSITFNDKRNVYFTASSDFAYNYIKNLIKEQ